ECNNPIGSRSRGIGSRITAPGQVFPHLAGGRFSSVVSSAAPLPVRAAGGTVTVAARQVRAVPGSDRHGDELGGKLSALVPVCPLRREGARAIFQSPQQ